MKQIDPKLVPSFYRPYMDQIGEESIVASLKSSHRSGLDLLEKLSDAEAEYSYADGKWSIKDILQHIIDTERIFAYRAMRFARNDKTDLPGFEQDDYVLAAKADDRTLADLLEEFSAVRALSILFFQSLSNEEMRRTGTGNGYEMSAEVLGYLISGHLLHHLSIISERYL